MTKFLLNILLSAALFAPCWVVLRRFSAAMAGSGLDVVLGIPLVLIAALLCWFFGGWLAKKIIDRDRARGGL